MNTTKKAISLPFLLIIACINALPVQAQTGQGQRIKFEHITIEDGLAGNSVWRILQDSKGFLWFATGYGLSRYDGYTFKNFRQGGPGTQSRDSIWALFEDHAGTLWVGPYGGGLNKFNAATQTFTYYQHDPENQNSLSNNVVRAIHELSGEPGFLWIATIGGGLNRFDSRNETFTHFRHNPNDPTSLPNNSVHTLYESRDGTLWLGTGDGFSRLNRADTTISFTNYRIRPGNTADLYAGGVTAILEGKDGAFWIGSNRGGLSLFKRELETYVHYIHDPENPNSISRGSVRALLEDASGELWIGIYDGGLNKFNRSSQTFTRYIHDPDDPNSLNHNVVRDIFEDNAGVLWVATYGGGLNKIVRNKFTLFQHEPGNPNSLSFSHVSFIREDTRGSIWVSMPGAGLTRMDFKTGEKVTFTHYQHDPDNNNSLGQNIIRSVVESRDKPGVFWLSTGNRGLNRFDSNEDSFMRFEHDPDNPNSLSSNRVANIHQSLQRPEIFWIGAARGQLNRLDVNNNGKFNRVDLGVHSMLEKIYESPGEPGVLWVGTNERGLIRFDSKNGTVEHIIQEDRTSDVPAHIHRIYESSQRPGVLWIPTTLGGFYKVFHNAQKGETKLVHYKHQPGNPNSLFSNNLWAFCETNDGIFWLGTQRGLSRFDPEKETFTNYTSEQGLPGNYIRSMLPDDKGRIWMTTNGGLSRFTPATADFRNYTVSDGLQGYSFELSALQKGGDGKLYFGGLNGLNMFHPDSVKDNSHVPPVVITGINIFNKPVKIDPDHAEDDFTLPAHISTLDEIVLSHRENVFSFEFAALDYTAPHGNQYAYKMEGLHKDWIDAGKTRTATFTNLEPGEYTFRVKGSNNDGVWNEEGTAMKVTILPPWWRTWWAYTFYALMIGLTLYGGRRYEKNHQQLKHDAEIQRVEAEKLQEVDHLKSRFFANISHEFRTPLTLIMGQTESLLSKERDREERDQLRVSHRNAEQLLTLVNQLLDLSKFEAGQMTLRASQQNIVTRLKRLTASFESWAAEKQIALQFETSHDVIQVWFEQEKIEKVMYNLLSNGLKFTPEGGNVLVKVESNPDPSPPSASSRQALEGGAALAAGGVKGEVKITVRDSGIGISKDRLPYVFDRFYQVDSATTREYEGSGIGLALAKELVQIHGGGISVESTENFGTTLEVTLPLGDAHLKPEQIVKESEIENRESKIAKPASTEMPLPEEQTPFDGESRQAPVPEIESLSLNVPIRDRKPEIVLIVEDNRDMRAFIGESLQDAYEIHEAGNGGEGFEKAQEHIPDLIITDVMMPKVDGYELTRRIREDQVTCHIPIVMLTAKAADEDKFEGLEKGVDAYLTKPFNKKELQIRVRKLIEMRQQLRQQAGAKAVLTPSEIEASSLDQDFLQGVQEVIEENIENEDFTVDDLATQMALSKRQLQRKLKALTDCSTQQCIRTMRLQRARQLLEQGAGNVSEITFRVGYGNVAAFSQAFREEFGQPPSAVKTRK